MKANLKLKSFGRDCARQLIYALRIYPLQILSAGLVSALFFLMLMFSLFLPHNGTTTARNNHTHNFNFKIKP